MRTGDKDPARSSNLARYQNLLTKSSSRAARPRHSSWAKKATGIGPNDIQRPKKSSASRRENAAQIKDINHIHRRSIQTLFAETELNLLRTIDGFKSFNEGDEDVFVVLCGWTDKKYGDTVGKLMVSSAGQFTISCDCLLEHTKKDKEKKHAESTGQIRVTPKEFESHARSGVRRWKNNISVIKGYKKVSLKKSGLLKYYKYVANESNWDFHISIFVHWDEFLSCYECQKERRFHLHRIDERRAFHDASRSINWKCADHCDM
ncbi:hypothetical protein ACLB2K_032068 [Fragaria x ananassa]